MHLLVLSVLYLLITAVTVCQDYDERNATTTEQSSMTLTEANCTCNSSEGIGPQGVVIIASSVVSAVIFGVMCLSIYAHYVLYVQKYKRAPEKESTGLVEMNDTSIYFRTELSSKLRKVNESGGSTFYHTSDDFIDIPLSEEVQQSQSVDGNANDEDKVGVAAAHVKWLEEEEHKETEDKKDSDYQNSDIMVDNVIYSS